MKSDLLKKKPLVDKFLRECPTRLSAFSFVNIFAWKDFFDFTFEIKDNCLCIFASNAIGTFLYLPPLGKNISSDVIQGCFETMERLNKGSGVSRIENVPQEAVKYFSSREFRLESKSEEYLYERKNIAEFSGNRFKSKRSSYNYFVKNFKCEYLPFKMSMKKECRDLYDSWASHKALGSDDIIFRQMLEDNRIVHQTVMTHYDSLELSGRVVCIDGKIKGYTFGFALNRDIFCVLFEIVDLSIKGLSSFIFKEFCSDGAVKPFRYINVMDDFGLTNIRKTKLSFHPSALVPSYVVSRKKDHE
ncbi:MAG: phosphatidylglycerol lysyltransferase domain-containing protein [Candidatus Omnitrophota bacterium]